MIKRVKVKGYKSLKDVEVEVQPLTLIFGPNAAGKSNLFDALGLLSQMVTKKTIREAFDEHRGAPLEAFSCGEKGLESLMDQSTAQFSIEVDVQLSPDVVDAVESLIRQMRDDLPSEKSAGHPARRRVSERLLRYSVTIEITTESGYLRVTDECLRALNKDGCETRKRRPFIEKIENRLHLRMEGQARPTHHDIGLDYTILSSPLYAPHYPHIAAFKEELSRWRFYYLEPKSMMRAENPIKQVDSLSPTGGEMAAFYNSLKANNPKQFNAVNRALTHLLPSIQKLDIERTREGFLQLRVIEDNVPFSSRVISEGTLRMLGLLAITSPLSPMTVVGYEEPENGVHPRRLKFIADLLTNAAESGHTQFIINTHSPLLPQYFDDSHVVVCSKENRFTTFTPFISYGPLFREAEIGKGLEDGTEGGPSLMERIVRGDFGG